MHELAPDEATLPAIQGWPTGDSRELLFTVTVDDTGTPKDISNDDLRWGLLDREYDDRADAVLTEASAGVTLSTDPVVDPTAGEFRVEIAEDTVEDWGRLYQEAIVDPVDSSRQTWVGPVVLTDS